VFQIIFAKTLEDPSFNMPWIRVVNICLNYAYLGLLIVCYVLALGDRPEGNKQGYIIVFFGFTFITLYMTVRLASTQMPRRSLLKALS
jgi:chitin synthase